MVLKEPVPPDAATRLIKQIALTGDVASSKHASDELHADHMTTGDCLNVMRCGAVKQPADLEHGSWRYRIETNLMTVVVAFRSETEVTIVTAWRHRR
jgi:hypothetical protein